MFWSLFLQFPCVGTLFHPTIEKSLQCSRKTRDLVTNIVSPIRLLSFKLYHTCVLSPHYYLIFMLIHWDNTIHICLRWYPIAMTALPRIFIFILRDPVSNWHSQFLSITEVYMLEFVLNFAHGYFYFAITLIGVFAKKKLAVVHAWLFLAK